MPRLGLRAIRPDRNKKAVEVELYYFEPNHYDSASFFIVIPEEYRDSTLNALNTVRRRGRKYVGIKADSEREATQGAHDYLVKFFSNAIVKTQVIIIQAGAYKAGDERDKESCKIGFSFIKGYYCDIDGKASYYRDKAYHGNDSQIWDSDIKKATILPYTDELLASCEYMVESLHKMNDKIVKLFETPESALKTLQKQDQKRLNG